jgi:Putative peptidoglycan binding domain
MNGEKVLQIATLHIGDEYLLGVMVPKDNSNWSGPWDCAEFVSWCVYQAASILYGCNNNETSPSSADAYTGYWQRDAKRLGQKVSLDMAAQTPGALVLRYPQPGLIGHIVISDGGGGTVEAHSRNTGVIRNQISGRRWDTGVLVPGIEYAQRSRLVDVIPPALIFRLTSPLTTGKKVKEIQAGLNAEGFNPGKIDGIYGPKTAAAVSAFQAARGLVADGETGSQTAAALGIELS